jgi:hypothetical protein
LVLADYTQPFNRPDVTYGPELQRQAWAALGFVPLNLTADAAFDAYHRYDGRPPGSLAAIALNGRGHSLTPYNASGQPLCSTCQVVLLPLGKQAWLEKGRPVRRFRCPTCQVVRKLVSEPGAHLRASLDRQSAAYKTSYKQRTACERINSQAEALGIQHPHQRRLAFIARRNTLIYLLINLRALSRFQQRSREPPLSPAPI